MSTIDHKETNAEYHADLTHVSNSMLKVFAESPQKYYRMFVVQTMPKPEQTPSLLLGSVVHCLFLEPEKFGVEYAVAPTNEMSKLLQILINAILTGQIREAEDWLDWMENNR
jgi:hypothetical protein